MTVWLGLEEHEDGFDGVDLMLDVDNSQTMTCCKKSLEDGVLGDHLWVMKEGKNGCLAIEDRRPLEFLGGK
jgi:hypothetical protein